MNPLSTFVLLVLLSTLSARAGGFDASLELSNGKSSVSAKSDARKDASPLTHRAVIKSSVDALLTAKWKVVRAAKDELKDALVHFYVVKLERQGQAPPPLEPTRVTVESALTMDFSQGQASSATQPFRVDGPGIYLVRIEAGGDPEKAGPESFAEMELVVK